jgi:hypothetical protein
MTSILSSISGIFSKTLILGIFLPVVVFIIFSLLFVVPLVPSDLTLLKPLEALDPQWKVLTITFVAILLSGLLYNLNIPLIRLYEGYPWRNTLLGRWKTGRQIARFERLRSRQRGMRTLQRQMKKVNTNDVLITAVFSQLEAISTNRDYLKFEDQDCPNVWDPSLNQSQTKWQQVQGLIKVVWEDISRRLLTEFPGQGSLVLPTRLGNVIRSFEYYPHREYGMDAITLWPRLLNKVEKDYASLIDDAKTSFDFMLNASALSGLLATLILLIGWLFGVPRGSMSQRIAWVAEILIFTVLAFILYFQSISRAAHWGEMVKGAFDLYRGKLLEQLGYEQKPKTKKAERTLWQKVSVQMIYSDSPDGPRTDYKDESPAPAPPTFARSTQPDMKLEVSRGIEARLADVTVVVALKVKNLDTTNKAQGVVLTDTLPPDLDYEWGSAHYNGTPLQEVSGTNPYRFSLGDINAGADVLVTYRAFQRK